MKVIIHQLYFDERSKSNCFKSSIKHKMLNFTKEEIWGDSINPFMENIKIVELSKGFEDDVYYGVLSHAFTKKTNLSERYLLERINDESYDVYTFNQSHRGDSVISNLNRWHNGAGDLLIEICESIGLPINNIKVAVYSNHFIAKGSIYKDYVNTWLKPFINQVIDKYESKVFKNAGYKKALMSKGFDYPLHSFITERLFSLYLANNNYKVR